MLMTGGYGIDGFGVFVKAGERVSSGDRMDGLNLQVFAIRVLELDALSVPRVIRLMTTRAVMILLWLFPSLYPREAILYVEIQMRERDETTHRTGSIGFHSLHRRQILSSFSILN